MTCDRIEELLSPYLEGELGDEERRLVDLHLGNALTAGACSPRSTEPGQPWRFPRARNQRGAPGAAPAIPGKKKRLGAALDFLLKPSLQPVFATAAVFMTLVSFYLFNPYKAAIDRAIDRKIHHGYSQVEKFYVKAGSFRDRLEARTDASLFPSRTCRSSAETRIQFNNRRKFHGRESHRSGKTRRPETPQVALLRGVSLGDLFPSAWARFITARRSKGSSTSSFSPAWSPCRITARSQPFAGLLLAGFYFFQIIDSVNVANRINRRAVVGGEVAEEETSARRAVSRGFDLLGHPAHRSSAAFFCWAISESSATAPSSTSGPSS